MDRPGAPGFFLHGVCPYRPRPPYCMGPSPARIHPLLAWTPPGVLPASLRVVLSGPFASLPPRLFAEDEVDGHDQTDEAGQMVPAQGVGLHEDQREDREDRQRDDLLDDLQLPDRERTSEFGRAEPVGRHLETILEEGDSPAHQDDQHQAEALEPRFEGDLPVPGQRHEGVGDDEQRYGGNSPEHK